MIEHLFSQARIAWVYASTDGKEQLELGATAIVISSLAYSIFGKKALFVSACALYAAFYFRRSFSNNSASLISAVISLPLCGFINPLSAIPSAIYLCYYILKHENEEQAETLNFQNRTKRLGNIEITTRSLDLKRLADTIESNNKVLAKKLPSRKELQDLQKEFTTLLKTVEEMMKAANKIQSNNKVLAEGLPSCEELQALKQELAALLKTIEKMIKTYESQP